MSAVDEAQMSLNEKVAEVFVDRFQAPPVLHARAPGRVNLIGEHTDYNDGFVLPMAIDRAVWIGVRPRTDRTVRVYSVDYDELGLFQLDDFTPAGEHWLEYVKGVAWALQEAGYQLTGWDGVMAGNVPVGAGLSSSAAVEMATARAFAALGDWTWRAATMARLGQRAENEWVGVNCGIMDQMISAAGRADHALLIDCRTLATELVPLPPGTAVLVLDTNTRRGLVTSAYNERRAQCETAAAFFGVPALRDVTLSEFERRAQGLSPVTRRRARHVISENERVQQAVGALDAGDAKMMGKLMNASHRSLRDDFAVSSAELDAMAACAQDAPGCFGARMTGGGFAGCDVALVETGAAAAVTDAVAACYQRTTGREATVYLCRASDGATAEWVDAG